MATLKDFLESATLGPVALGLAAEEVRHLLGEPENRGGRSRDFIWKYGSMQLGFHRDKATGIAAVVSLGLYFRDEKFVLPEVIRLEGWFPNHSTRKEDFVRFLADNEICHAEDTLLTFETQVALTTESGANVIFAGSTAGTFLDSIQHASRAESSHPAPHTKNSIIG